MPRSVPKLEPRHKPSSAIERRTSTLRNPVPVAVKQGTLALEGKPAGK